MISKEYLANLRETAEFQSLLAYLKEQRPEIPSYIPDPDNTKEWRKASLIRQGFDKCLVFLGEKLDD